MLVGVPEEPLGEFLGSRRALAEAGLAGVIGGRGRRGRAPGGETGIGAAQRWQGQPGPGSLLQGPRVSEEGQE